MPSNAAMSVAAVLRAPHSLSIIKPSLVRIVFRRPARQQRLPAGCETTCRRSAMSQAASVVSKHAIKDVSPANIAHQIDDNARIVLVGDATHGTSDFYARRAEITKELICNHGFHAVSVEAGRQWIQSSPSCFTVCVCLLHSFATLLRLQTFQMHFGPTCMQRACPIKTRLLMKPWALSLLSSCLFHTPVLACIFYIHIPGLSAVPHASSNSSKSYPAGPLHFA